VNDNPNSVFIIAEAGVNHNGSIELAKELVNKAFEAGADAVKFQSFRAEKITSRIAQKADYQKLTTGESESQFEMLRKLELSVEDHLELVEYCNSLGIKFLSTPFDLDSLDLLVKQCNVPMLKIPSGEITNAELLLAMARTGLPIIMSSGMTFIGEVEEALGVLAFGYTAAADVIPSRAAFRMAYCCEEGQKAIRNKVTLLHCTTEYPTPYQDVNLRTMDTLKAAFGLPVGLSDHTDGIAVPIAAVARGASIIEKHFTLDRDMQGPDHKASLDPLQLQEMVKSIRQVEAAMGSANKLITSSEMSNKNVARKSLVAACSIDAGEIFTAHNLTSKRPGTGRSPMEYWDLLGKRAERSYLEDELID
jgi:N-acetylneuraminate synthase